MDKLIRRRIADVQRAMAAAKAESARTTSASPARDPKHLIGRWALTSGTAFAVRWVDVPNARALCSGGGRRWWLTVADLHSKLDRGLLRYLGRGNR